MNGIKEQTTGRSPSRLEVVLEPALDLLFPLECLACQEPTSERLGFCLTCTVAIRTGYHCCRVCATPLPEVVPNDDCFRCRDESWRFDRVLALGPYEETVRDVVIKMKKTRAAPLRYSVGQLLAEMCREQEHADLQSVVLPVPNHWSHRFQGVANTAGALASKLAKELSLPLEDRVIRRIRKTQKQGMLPWTERRKNVRGAFKVTSAETISGRHIYLVDDVVTSGATVHEVAKVLRAAGATSVTVVVVARGKGARENVANS